jgi:hypothetical protein
MGNSLDMDENEEVVEWSVLRGNEEDVDDCDVRKTVFFVIV